MRTHSASYGFKKIETFDIFFASPLKGNQILHQMKDQKSMKFNTSQEMHSAHLSQIVPAHKLFF